MGAASGHPPPGLMPQLRLARGRLASDTPDTTSPPQRPEPSYRETGEDMPVAFALDVAAGPVTD